MAVTAARVAVNLAFGFSPHEGVSFSSHIWQRARGNQGGANKGFPDDLAVVRR
jgi:hypothetical protein